MVFLTIVTGANLNQLITFGGPTLYSIGLLENRTRYPPNEIPMDEISIFLTLFPYEWPFERVSPWRQVSLGRHACRLARERRRMGGFWAEFCGVLWGENLRNIQYPLVICYIAIENGHL